MNSSSASLDSTAGVKSARRTIDLLEGFAADYAWMTLTDLHERTGIPRSSLHGLLRTLLDVRWIEADAAGTRFRLGVRALVCGTAYLDRDPAMPFAAETLERIRDATGFTTHYARLDGDQVVYLETRDSHSDHVVSKVGRALPAHSTAMGKALLAEWTEAEVAALLPAKLPALTEHTITDRDALCTDLAASRERGFALEREEGTPGICCAAAVVPYRIPATDAISCSVPIDLAGEAEMRGLGERLSEACVELGARLRREGIR